jgi:hypothetical protein
MTLFTEEMILSPSTAHRLPHSKGLKLTNWLLAKHKINAYAFFIDDDLLKAGFHNDRARAFADLWRQLPDSVCTSRASGQYKGTGDAYPRTNWEYIKALIFPIWMLCS